MNTEVGQTAHFSRRSRVAIIALAALSMVAVLLTVSSATQVAEAQVSTLPPGTTCFSFDESDAGAGNAGTHTSFLHTITNVDGTTVSSAAATASLVEDPALTIAGGGQIENIAVRNDTGQLFAYEPSDTTTITTPNIDPDIIRDELYEVDPATGALTLATDFPISGLGDVDAMFFVDDVDGDPSNDVLWVVEDNGGVNALTGFDISGAVVAGPITLLNTGDLGNNSVEGATWIPDTGEFLITHTVTGAGDTSTLASLGTGSVPSNNPINVGASTDDIEGLGTDGAGGLYATTGEDPTGGATVNQFWSIDPDNGGATSLADMTINAPANGDSDFESVDCSFASVDLLKEVGPVTDNGDGTFTYDFTFTITNDGAEPISNILFSDDYAAVVPGATASVDNTVNGCFGVTLNIDGPNANGTSSCVITETVTFTNAAAGDYTNTAEVDATGAFGSIVEASSTVDVTIPAINLPDLSIVKTVVEGDSTGCPGADSYTAAPNTAVTYCVTVTNNGLGQANNVVVTDTVTTANGDVTLTASPVVGAVNLGPGESQTYFFPHTTGSADESNTATANGFDVSGTPLPEIEDDAGTLVLVVAQPVLEISKWVVASADTCGNTVPAPDVNGAFETITAANGDNVIYCIGVTNTGSVDVIDIAFADTVTNAAGVVATYNGGSTGPLAPQASVIFPIPHQVAGDTPETNTVELTGGTNILGQNAAGIGSTDQAGTIPPAQLTLVKTVVAGNGACPGVPSLNVAEGDTVTYCVVVTNSGSVPVPSVLVSDQIVDPANPNVVLQSFSSITTNNLAVGASDTFTYVRTVGATDELNTASLTLNGTPISDTAQTVFVEPIISITKTVIDGANGDCALATETTSVVSPGDIVTYCVTVTNTGTGAATGVVVSDEVTADPGGASLEVFPATAATTIQPGASVTYTYTRTVGTTDEVNTASVVGTNFSPPAAVTAGTTLQPEPEISITKTVIAGANGDCALATATTIEVNEGDIVTYCVTVTNTGTGAATGVVVSDEVTEDPGGASLEVFPATAATTIQPGASVTYTYTRTVGATYEINTASVVGTNFDPPAAVTAGTTLPPQLQIVKSVVLPAAGCPTYANAVAAGNLGLDQLAVGGQDVRYCVTVVNAGPGIATGVQITDSFLQAQPVVLGNLAPGAEQTIQYVHSSTAGIEETNTATVTSTNAASDSDTAGTTPEIIAPEPDVTITKSVVAGPNGDCAANPTNSLAVSIGDQVTYCVTVTNTGPGEAIDVVVSDEITNAAGVVVSNYADTAPFTLGAAGSATASQSFEYERTVGTTNEGNLASAQGPNITQVFDTAGTTLLEPVITIEKTVAAGANGDCATAVESLVVAANTPVTYCVTVTNTGPGNAVGVTVADAVVVNGTPVTLTADPAVGPITLAANGGTQTYTFAHTTGTGDELNTATVSGDNFDPLTNDAGTSLQPKPLLVIEKTVTAGANADCATATLSESIVVADGAPVTYCVTVTNNGAGPATNVELVDTVDVNGTAVTLTANPAVGVVTLAANGGTQTYTFPHTAGSTDELNTASAKGDNVDPVSDTAGTTAVLQPNLSIAKTVAAGNSDCTNVTDEVIAVPANSTVTYCVVVTNAGPGTAFAVEVADEVDVNGTAVVPFGFPNTPVDIPALGSQLFQFFHTAGATDETNTATATGTDELGGPLTPVSDTAGTTPLVVLGPPILVIEKTVVAGPNGDCAAAVEQIVASENDIVTYCVTVTNTGQTDALNVVVADAVTEYPSINNDLETFADTPGVTLAANGGSANYTFERTVGTTGEQNTATVTADNATGQLDTARTTQPPLQPELTIEKTVVAGANGDCTAAVETIEVAPGDVVTYCVLVSNVGVGPAQNVVVTDVVLDADGNSVPLTADPVVGPITLNAPVGFVFPNTTFQLYTFPHTVGSVDEVNTATVNYTDGLGTPLAPVSNDASVTVAEPVGSLGNYVWEDTNGDGIQGDPALEPGVAGVTVQATGPDGVTLTATTDSTGFYEFPDLALGSYFVVFLLPQNREFTAQGTGDGTNDSDVTALGVAGFHDVTAGAPNNDTVDAGLLPAIVDPLLGGLGSYVWNDLDSDGAQDLNQGVKDITVTAVNTVTGQTYSAITNSQGEYLITGMVPGDYTVSFSTPAGRTWTLQDQVTDEKDSDVDLNGFAAGPFTVVGGADNLSVDAGLVPIPVPVFGALGNYVWEDTNEDGVQGSAADEPPVAGVAVTAIGPSGTLTTFTDAAGLYSFTGLIPGDYTVLFTAPAGRTWTTQDAAAGGLGDDSDADSMGNAGSHLVEANLTNDTVDAGLVPIPVPVFGALGNYVWEDTNEDGVQDAGEPPVAGVEVTAIGPSGTLTTMTDAAGLYSFTGLIPGDYTVLFTTPAGRTWTTQDAAAGGLGDDSDADSVGNAGSHPVEANLTNDTVDAGLTPIIVPGVGALGNFVWEDANGNGLQDDTEVVEGVAVMAIGPSGTLTTVTDEFGNYQFNNLIPGFYTVLFTAPDGRSWTLQDVAGSDEKDSDVNSAGNAGSHLVEEGLTNNDVDAGLAPIPVPVFGELGDYVWEDTNEDGVQDAGEPPVAGVAVTAIGPSGTLETTTDADGLYEFVGLIPGEYLVIFTAPDGRSWTVPNAAAATDDNDSDASASGVAGSHTVLANEDNDSVDAGLIPITDPVFGELGDYVWEDTNEDGVQDAGEPPVAGVAVTAIGPSGTLETTTDADGLYEFVGLIPGDYVVIFTAPAGRTWTAQDAAAGTDETDSDVDSFGVAGTHTVLANEDNDSVDAGLIPITDPVFGELGDYVWEDTNEDGVQDAGEPPVAGVTVTAIGPSGTLETTTDADGLYEFVGLIPGDYVVIFTTPAGRTWTAQDAAAGTDEFDSDVDSFGVAGTHTVLANDDNDSVDAGLIPLIVPPLPGAIGDFVWEDANENGLQDADEGVEGVTVTAIGPSGTQSDTTDADGAYLIDDLIPGTYTVLFTTPAGREWTVQNVGADEAIDSDVDSVGFAGQHLVVEDTTNSTVDAGLLPIPDPILPGAIGSYVWEDTNEDGVQDAGEGVEGVTVIAIGAAGQFQDITDADGEYLITGLIPGDYTVLFTTPDGRVWTTPNVGDDTTDSDADTSGNAGVHTVVSDTTNPTVDAGLLPVPPELGAIGSYVWEDTDSDGIQELGEGVEGVLVTAIGVAGTFTDTTDANGEYNIGALPPGDYIVTFTTPTGRAWTAPNVGDDATDSDADAMGVAGVVTVVAATTNDTVDAGLLPVATPLGGIGNYVWEDTDSDGVQDAGEGVAGVTVTAIGPSGTVSDITDATGAYLIENLLPGIYAVSFAAPDGRTWTLQDIGDDATDSDVNSAGMAGAFEVEPGVNNLTVDAGLVPPAVQVLPGAIGSYVWEDANGNGIQDDTEGVAGVTVTAIGPSGTLTTVTGANGEYLIEGLAPGDYTVLFTTPTGRTWTLRDVGDDATDSDVDSAGNAGVHAVVANTTNDTVDAGLAPVVIDPDKGSLGSYVWEDIDGDGVQDAGEGVPGVTVTAIGPSGTLTTVTGADGVYTFTDLIPGTYTVLFTAPAGRTFTTANVGDDATDSDADATGNAGQHEVLAGLANDTVDAGIAPETQPPAPGSIGSFVWEDIDGDGIQDPGEGVAGVTVTAIGPAGTIVSTTNAAGEYLLAGLTPGTYTVIFTAPDGRTWTQPNVGDDDAVDSDPDTNGIAGQYVVVSGVNIPDVDAGLAPLVVPPAGSTVGNLVFDDLNGDGIQDPGEPGVAGVEVTVAGPSGSFTTTTNVNGEWAISDLAPGDYTIIFTAPAGREFTTPDAPGSTDATDSDVASNGTTSITVVAGTTVNDVDAGLAPVPAEKATVGNNVWIDANGDGIQQADEAPVVGAEVKVWSVNADGTPNAVVATVYTDATGTYTSGPLDAGDYILQFLTPDGHYLTTGPDSDPNANGLTPVITLAPGANDDTVDAGYVPYGSIGNLIFNDANGNGIQDAAEAAVAGATVTLTNSAGTVIGSVVTGANGEYLFDGLLPGDYTVTLTPPSGFNLAPANAGNNDAADSDFNASTGQATVTVGINDTNVTIDGGVVAKPIVGSGSGGTVIARPEYPGPFKVVPNSPTTAFTAKSPIPSAAVPSTTPLVHTGSQASTLAIFAIAMVGAGGLFLLGSRREDEVHEDELDV